MLVKILRTCCSLSLTHACCSSWMVMINEKEIQSEKQTWYKSKENVKQYLMRKYPTEEEVKRLKNVEIMAYSYIMGYNREGFTFKDKELIWDSMLLRYGIENGYSTKYTFPLVNVDNLTQLAYQLDENN